jgi:hypothetical protein
LPTLPTRRRPLSLLLAKSRYASLAVTPAGFMLSVFLTNRYFHNSQSGGIYLGKRIPVSGSNDQQRRAFRLVKPRPIGAELSGAM